MGARENKVEKYLDSEVTKLGGLTRKWVSPGRDGVPDRICIIDSTVWFVEIKTVDGKLTSIQEREHDRLRTAGDLVHTVDGEAEVDAFIEVLSV